MSLVGIFLWEFTASSSTFPYYYPSRIALTIVLVFCPIFCPSLDLKLLEGSNSVLLSFNIIHCPHQPLLYNNHSSFGFAFFLPVLDIEPRTFMDRCSLTELYPQPLKYFLNGNRDEKRNNKYSFKQENRVREHLLKFAVLRNNGNGQFHNIEMSFWEG